MNSITVNIAEQSLSLFDEHGELIKRWPVSTSKYGTGCARNSYKTPLGLHRIHDKIGAAMPIYEVLEGRLPKGNLHELQAQGVELPEDVITSRILWLEGMEPGRNQGGYVDTCERYIYIHGTSDEDNIGKPASVGCVRMRNEDVVELFRLVEVGTEVNIIEGEANEDG